MSKVLIIIPHDRFRDEEFESVFKVLTQGGHNVQVGSNHHTEAKGHFGLLVKPEVNIYFVEPGDFDAFVFIGGRGVEEFFTESRVHNLIRNIYHERKLIAAIGTAVELLVYAGIISGKKITCHPSIISNIQSAGAYYTGRIVEIDGDIITATDERAKAEFAETILKAINHIDPRRGLR
jgi:protease I